MTKLQVNKPYLGLSVRASLVVMLAVALLTQAVACRKGDEGSTTNPNPRSTTASDELSLADLTITSGAAPGYVNDQVCAKCHQDLYDSYQHVGMAKSFYPPSADSVIEDFDENRFYHEPSRRYYEMTQRDGQYFFKRFQLDEKGTRINVFQRKVDWILGSGNHSRTYLYQTEAGELYQLPVAWYSQDKAWNMAPGYDRPDHEGVGRRVQRECMFCHNAYPDVPAGSDHYGAAQFFPKEMAHGIGCQRCHGPGAEHVKAALAKKTDKEIASSIVNPSQLDAKLREDVCYSCHLQPSVALFGLRRFGRDTYSFRPGESLDDHFLQLDVKEEGQAVSERFEINHHPYRLAQSRCFTETQGGISCLSCHDPHRVVPAAKRSEHYRAACFKCHQDDDCTKTPGDVHQFNQSGLGVVEANDCVTCHMPKRRTQDVVHVVMTDHKIQRTPGTPQLLAPLKESEPVIEDVVFLDPSNAPQGHEADIYRTIAILRATSFRHPEALTHLEQMLAAKPLEAVEPYIDLAEAQIKQRKYAEAEATVGEILKRQPDDAQAQHWLGLALIGQGKNSEAIEHLQQLVKSKSTSPEAHYNLGLVLLAVKRFDRAAEHFQKAVESRPNLIMAWFYLGNVYVELNRYEEAIDCYRRTLAIEPGHRRAYAAIREALAQIGETTESMRFWRHGMNIRSQRSPSEANVDAAQTVTEEEKAQLAVVVTPQLDGLEESVANQIQSAEQSFRQLMAQDDVMRGELAEAFGTLAQLYHAYEMIEPAEACYINASQLMPNDFRWPHLLGALYEATGELEKAVDQFKAAWSIQRTYSAIPTRLGNVYVQMNRLNDAREQYDVALRVNASEPAAHAGLGDVMLAMKKYDEAVKHYERALQMVPAANRLHYSLAMAYRELGETDKANEHLQKHGKVGIRPIDPLLDQLRDQMRGEHIHLIRGHSAFNAGRYEEAADAFAKAVDANPKSARALVNLGTSLARLGDDDKAFERYQQAIEHEEGNFAANYNLGIISYRRGQYAEAVEFLKTAVQRRPKDVEANRQLGRAFAQTDSFEDAMSMYSRVLKLSPDDEGAMIGAAEVWLKQGKYQDAFDMLDQAHARFPTRIETAHEFARLLASCPDKSFRNGEHAVQIAAKVYELEPTLVHGETLAMALAQADQCEEAAALQRKLIEGLGENPAEQTLERLKNDLLRYEKGSPCGPPTADVAAEKQENSPEASPMPKPDEGGEPPTSPEDES